jgi:F-type H+-transporting ATPase subunit delta
LSRVANRYSKALFHAAREENKIDSIDADLKAVQNLIIQNAEFRGMLINPLIPATKKTELMSHIFKGKVDILTHRFLQMVCDKNRSNLLLEIINRFYELLYAFKGILKGKIISAQALDSEEVQNINEKIKDMTGKKVELELETDADLVGGFIVKIEDTIIDLSVKGQLDKLRKKLVFG